MVDTTKPEETKDDFQLAPWIIMAVITTLAFVGKKVCSFPKWKDNKIAQIFGDVSDKLSELE